MNTAITTGGVFSWVDGFTPDAKAKRLTERQRCLVEWAKRDPDGCFDHLWEECRYTEAAWLIEHLDRLGG